MKTFPLSLIISCKVLKPVPGTHRNWPVTYSPLDDGGKTLPDHRPWFIQKLHADLLTVHQQLHLLSFYTQCQLVPLTVKEFFHPLKGPQHLCASWAGVEEVQGFSVALKTKAHLVPALRIADLPQIPGCFSSVLGHFEGGDDRVVWR